MKAFSFLPARLASPVFWTDVAGKAERQPKTLCYRLAHMTQSRRQHRLRHFHLASPSRCAMQLPSHPPAYNFTDAQHTGAHTAGKAERQSSTLCCRLAHMAQCRGCWHIWFNSSPEQPRCECSCRDGLGGFSADRFASVPNQLAQRDTEDFCFVIFSDAHPDSGVDGP